MENKTDLNTYIYNILDERSSDNQLCKILEILDVKLILEQENLHNTQNCIEYILKKHEKLFMFSNQNIDKSLSQKLNRLQHIYITDLTEKEKINLILKLFQILINNKRYYGILTSYKIVAIILNNFNLTAKSRIYNPYCFIGDFFLGLISNQDVTLGNIFFDEKNKEALYLFKLVYYFITSRHLNENNIISIESCKEKFDIIITNPPFINYEPNSITTLNLDPAYTKFKRNNSFLLLHTAKNLLNNNGAIAIIIPEGLIHQKDFRKWLSDNFKINKIVSLPAEAFKPQASVKTSILFLENSIKQKNYSFEYALIEDNEFEKVMHTQMDINNFISNDYPEVLYNKLTPNIDNYIEKYFTKLTNCVTVISSKTPDIKYNLPKAYIDISSINNITGKIENAKYFKTVEELPQRASYKVNTGDVLLAVTSGALGTKSHSVAIVTEEYDQCVCANTLKVLRPGEMVDPYYLWYFLRSEYFLSQVNKLKSGSTIPNLKDKDIKSIKLYLPSLEEQKAIREKVIHYIESYENSQKALLESENEIKKLIERRDFL